MNFEDAEETLEVVPSPVINPPLKVGVFEETSPAQSSPLDQTETQEVVAEVDPVKVASAIDDTLLSETEPYWTPGAEVPALANPESLDPIEFREDPISPVTMEAAEVGASNEMEDPEEPGLYDNPIAGSGADVLGFNSLNSVGFAPVSPPTGFHGLPLGSVGVQDKSMLHRLGFVVHLSGTYDSNVLQSGFVGQDHSQDDFITGLGGTLTFQSQARIWTFGGRYTGAYNYYLNNPEFSGYTQNGSLFANYNGAKLGASVTTNISTGRGGNRFLGTSNFVEQTQVSAHFSANYSYSEKTEFTTEAGTAFTTTDGGNFSNTNSGYLGFVALWKYSPLTSFGPGVRFSRDSGGGSNVRTSIAPTLNFNYAPSSKLLLNSQLGLAFGDYSEFGESDTSITASIGLRYQASPLWGLDFSLFRNYQADPSVSGSFRRITAARIGYTRKIQRVNLGLGLSYENSTAANNGSISSVARPNRDYFSIDGSLGTRTFKNTTDALLFLRYSEQFADVESYDAFQIGFSLSRGF